jgi:hypothetical protein
MDETNFAPRRSAFSIFFKIMLFLSPSLSPSPPYRFEYTPGAPPRYSTIKPESSAMAGRPVASAAAAAFLRALS